MPRSKETPLSPIQRRLIGLILTMVVIIPFVATPMDARLHGLAALAFEGLSIFALALLLLGSRWRLDKDSLLTFAKTGVNLPVVLFLALCTVSAAFSPMKGYSLQELLRVTAGCLVYFAVSYQFRHSNQLNKLVNTLIGVGAVAALYGFYQYAVGGRDMAAGMFEDHQTLGSFLMLILPFAAVVALTEKQRNRQLLALVAVVFIASGLLISQCRSAWVGAAFGLAAMAGLTWQIATRERTRLRKQDLIPSIGLCVGAVFLFLLLWPQGDAIGAHIGTFGNVPGEHSVQERMQTWKDVGRMVASRPLAGFGLGLLPYYLPDYQMNLHKPGHQPMVHAVVPDFKLAAHSVYLQTAAELGIPGLLLWLAIPVTFCIAAIRRLMMMHAGVRRNLLMASVATVVAFCFDAFANPSWQLGQISMFLWLTMGIGVSSMIPVTRREERYAEPAAPQWFRRPAVAVVVLCTASLLPTAVVAGADGYGNALVPIVLAGSDLLATVLGPPAVIGPGQSIIIVVAGHPEFNWKGNIDPDGTIAYPPLLPDKVQVAGLSRTDVAGNIQALLESANKIGETDTVTVDNIPPRNLTPTQEPNPSMGTVAPAPPAGTVP